MITSKEIAAALQLTHSGPELEIEPSPQMLVAYDISKRGNFCWTRGKPGHLYGRLTAATHGLISSGAETILSRHDTPARTLYAMIVGRWFLPDGEPEPKITIGENADIDQSARIGTRAVAYCRVKTGENIPFPQIANVVIGQNVTIGPHSTVRRGSLHDTVIGDNVKIGASVTVGHGAKVGDSTVLCGHSCIAGSAVIGKDCMIGIGAHVVNGAHVPDGTFVKAHSLVTKKTYPKIS